MSPRYKTHFRINDESLLSKDPLERVVKARHIRMLEEAGFKVCDLSQPRAVYGGLVNFPDVIAFYNESTVLIEEKKKGGPVREGQVKFGIEIAPHTGKHLRHLIAPTDDQLWNVINEIRSLPWRNRDKDVVHVVTGFALQEGVLIRWPVKGFRNEAMAKAYLVKVNAVRESMAHRRKEIEERPDLSPVDKQKAILKLYNQYDKVNNSFNGHPDCGEYRIETFDFEG